MNKEDDGKLDIGIFLTILAITSIFIVGTGIYAYISEPYRIADVLRDKIDGMDDVSEDYRSGWLDCIEQFLYEKTKAVNMTSSDLVCKEK